MGAYAMALFVLGFGEAFGNLTDARRDEEGLLLDEERLPKRVRIKKAPTAIMKRTIKVFVGDEARWVGTLHYDAVGSRERSAFAYADDVAGRSGPICA